jgi:hypothetical protein
MALTNNTKYRNKKITITKKLNGSLVTEGGFPLTISLLSAFTGYPALTETQFLELTDAAYTTRLNAFYTHLEATYSFYNRNTVQNPTSGTDAVSCPLDNSPAPVISVISIGGFLVAGPDLTSNYLGWTITIDQVAPIPISYFFDIAIKDKHGNLIRTETVNGIILAGLNEHSASDNNIAYYIAEADNASLTPLFIEAVNGSAVLNY